MQFFIQILGNCNEITTSSLLLCVNKNRYLFNCSEGTYRLMIDNEIKFSAINRVFLTRVNGECGFGLCNFFTSLAYKTKSSNKKFLVHGPQDTSHLIKIVSTVTPQFNSKYQTFEHYTTKDAFKDKAFSVDTIAITNQEQNEESVNQTVCSNFDAYDFEKTTELQQLYNSLKSCSKPYQISLAYLVRIKELKGKFNIVKAKKLGVKKNEQFAQLSKGKPVTLLNGEIIKPEDIISPNINISFLIIDLPNKSFLNSLLHSDEFNDYQITENNNTQKKQLYSIFYWINDEILSDERFQKWVIKFGPQTQHVFLYKQQNNFSLPFNIPFHSSFFYLSKCNLINSNLFPINFQENELFLKDPQYIENFNEKKKKQLKITFNDKYHFGTNQMKFHLVPMKLFGFDLSLKKKITERINKEKNNLKKLSLKLNQNNIMLNNKEDEDERIINNNNNNNNHSSNNTKNNTTNNTTNTKKNEINIKNTFTKNEMENLFIQILFLGTGGGSQSKYRNTPGIFIRVTEDFNILLDCGEGSFGQLMVFYKQKISEILLNLKFIWISHIHGDHCHGLLKLLHMREKVYKLKFGSLENYQEPLIVGPSQLKFLIKGINYISQDLEFCKIYTHQQFDQYCNNNSQNLPKFKSLSDHFQKIIQIPVIHCVEAHAIVLIRNGMKIVYSGDCKPSQELIKLGKCAEILIHETAFLSSDKNLKKKYHTTIFETIEIFQQIEAHWLLLTHYSPKNKRNVIESFLNSKIAFAFDLMSITPKNIHQIGDTSKTICEHLIED
ncbi:zinc phosphodiesterase elac protein [Anaeramoeba flamelloides]|uniref:ribonuclease Z n=1 Tax=Anaeramoeba flamelloides TaxID=1746091 RepID=A0ABQ8YPG6_9EUKA|nr:zinc phosphodiesterase elac protein [Anaeramoeba flamelloides]